MRTSSLLTPRRHDRNATGMTYVYPVISRRAGGVSVGINLNPNNACNWRCIYCQVPGLTRGNAPSIVLDQLEDELRRMLGDILHGDFMQQHVPPEARQLQDVAFSGNGEPTSAQEFPEAVRMVERVLRDCGLLSKIRIRLITNGSLMEKTGVLPAIAYLARCNGEVWFKVDAATSTGIARINDVHLDPQVVLRRLRACAQTCPTWVQTCLFAWHGMPPEDHEVKAYLTFLASAKEIAGVHLYGVARPSMQPEAAYISALPIPWLENLAERIRNLGIAAHVSP